MRIEWSCKKWRQGPSYQHGDAGIQHVRRRPMHLLVGCLFTCMLCYVMFKKNKEKELELVVYMCDNVFASTGVTKKIVHRA
jgi:DNA repair photolyase